MEHQINDFSDVVDLYWRFWSHQNSTTAAAIIGSNLWFNMELWN